MSQLVLSLPDKLHQKLMNLAQDSGISLENYIVSALAWQANSEYKIHSISEEEVEQQKRNFDILVNRLGTTSPAEIEQILAQRETIQPEEGLNSDDISYFQHRIKTLLIDK